MLTRDLLPSTAGYETCGLLLIRRQLPTMGPHTIEIIFRSRENVMDMYGIEYIWYAGYADQESPVTVTSCRYSADVVAGAALGGAFGFALFTAIVWCVVRWRRENNSCQEEHNRFDIDEGVIPTTNMGELDPSNPETGPVNLVSTSSDNK
ncbi:hypothetical protein FRC02_009722 [Tulasnella sp. 418]|nr:hypothetical protein FRC02_009722 [Tulasnella sp. 418]